ncbi:putative signal transducing protein [Geofilum rubicundum]|uniref:DUF2007 domain-containing protein n=1 Tax=Geofilum rubicundum JCM 15548 TaxID=1236989 RepID=A0A0E9LWM1_9BACT|nr:DUF2007 domain-containing protein [Geofilum rubicundum]GAO29962.1 hypothetical protein JCM15548_12199 [Geofilum rubicundum JCM 15548]
MDEDKGVVRVYTGREVQVGILKGVLEEAGITSMVRDEFQASISAGFVNGVPSALDLYIQEGDLAAAEPIINDFLKNNA